MMPPYLAATRPHRDAADLLARYGNAARARAGALAAASRRLGNHIHFCRWREVERLIVAMTRSRGAETLH